jgi:hypothetical protein
MKYRAKRLNRNTEKFYVGEDLELTYYIVDENDNIVYDLSDFTFTAKLYSDGDSGLEFDEATYMTVSDEKVTVSIPNTSTIDFVYEERYIFELSATENSKKHVLLREEIYFGRELS